MIATSTSRRARPAPSATISPTTSAPASRSDRNSPVCRRSRISAPFGTICRSTARRTTSLPEATPSSVCSSRRQVGSTTNFGVRAREEVHSRERRRRHRWRDDRADNSRRRANELQVQNERRHLTSVTIVSAEREMTNVAPELGVVYTPTPRMAMASARRNRLRHAAVLEPVRELRTASPATTRISSRKRMSASMSAATGRRRPAYFERNGLLRVLQKRTRLAVAAGPSGCRPSPSTHRPPNIAASKWRQISRLLRDLRLTASYPAQRSDLHRLHRADRRRRRTRRSTATATKFRVSHRTSSRRA